MSSQQCQTVCPKFAICEALVQKGEEAYSRAFAAGYGTNPDVEYMTEDGDLISGSDMVRTIPEEVAQQLMGSGEMLISSGRELGRLLLDGCDEGPFKVGQSGYICRSKNKNIGITQEDIDRT